MRLLLLSTTVALGLMTHGRLASARDAHLESVEWLTVDADLVVHGTLVRSQRGADVGATGRRWDRATILVKAVLKGEGPKSGELSFAVPAAGNWAPPRWDEPGAESLFFLVNSERVRPDVAPGLPSPCRFALQLGGDARWRAVRLDVEARPPGRGEPAFPFARSGAWTIDFQHLTSRGPILAAAREAIRTAPAGMPKAYELTIPWPLLQPEGPWINSVRLTVPLDRRLEEQARKSVRSGAPYDLLAALRVIRHFRSDENIALLKGLLANGESVRVSENGQVKRVYPVRTVAVRILKEWGVTVEEAVVTEEPLTP